MTDTNTAHVSRIYKSTVFIMLFEEKENLPYIYESLGERFSMLDSWSMYVITAYEDAVKYMGRKPDKNRKVYNGMMKTYFYSFIGPKPGKRERDLT